FSPMYQEGMHLMTIAGETWQHRDIITNGIRMHYVMQGESEGPLVVLLHGFPEFWYSWRNQLPFLARHGYTVVAPDLRGYNDSDKPRNGYDVPTLIADIAGLIRGLGREQAVIVGHDWGGALAWAFAARYPQMTERLIVLNAPHPAAMMRDLRTLQQLRKSWYIFFFQLPWLPEYALLRNHAEGFGRMLRGAAVQKQAFPSEIVVKYQEAMSKPGAMTAALSYYRQLFRALPVQLGQDAEETPRITSSTLLIWGVQDIALGLSLTKGLEQWVDNIQVKYVADSGHWVQQEKPELVNTFMLEFLQQ
ncbi:MAG TPA: alpha/beta hydrolase, partial [Ktedonobacteraceae bacterium]|nr:alpha/beta hydrolase [Ktedonobacteraceae bacterium]